MSMHTYTYTHTHTYICIHSYIHIHTHTRAHAQTHTHIHTYIHIHIHAHTENSLRATQWVGSQGRSLQKMKENVHESGCVSVACTTINPQQCGTTVWWMEKAQHTHVCIQAAAAAATTTTTAHTRVREGQEKVIAVGGNATGVCATGLRSVSCFRVVFHLSVSLLPTHTRCHCVSCTYSSFV